VVTGRAVPVLLAIGGAMYVAGTKFDDGFAP
jgi:hypothetical protein